MAEANLIEKQNFKNVFYLVHTKINLKLRNAGRFALYAWAGMAQLGE
jgi:hypothetical protein